MSELRGPSKSFKELLVWQKAHELQLFIYKETRGFPEYELYGLTSQLRRAAVSIAANIAEGYKRRGLMDKIKFLNIAQSSLSEVSNYLILATDLGYLKSENHELLESVGKLIVAYTNGIKRRIGEKHQSKQKVQKVTGSA